MSQTQAIVPVQLTNHQPIITQAPPPMSRVNVGEIKLAYYSDCPLDFAQALIETVLAYASCPSSSPYLYGVWQNGFTQGD